MVFKSPYPDLDIPDVDVWNLIFNNPVLSAKNRIPDNKVLIIDPIGKREFTYGQLRDLSRAVGRNLQAKLRLQVGERIAIFSPNCPEYIIAVLGIAACGATISPASAGFSANELIYQLETSGSTALITHAALLDTALKAAQATNMPKERIFVIPEAPAATIPGGLTSFDALLSETGGSKLAVPRLNAKKELFALPYSSGTTGRPKGVKLSHFNIVANALQCVSIAAQGEVDVPPSHEVSVSILPFSHIYGLLILVLVSVMTGRTQIILPRFELVAYLELVQKYKCNKGYIVPPILTAFAKHPIIDKYDLSSLRQYGLMCAAAPLSVELIDAVYDRLQIPIYQAMGMTEASPATHMSRIESWKEGKGGVGTLVPNMEARLVDIDGKDVAPGESGELWVRGPNIFLGYHNNPAATADCMSEDGYYKTGDVARIDPKTGNFYITDRVKELIKYKGFQVPPAELEGVLSAHPKIADVAVVGIWKEEEQTEVPRAYVVLQAGHAASKELEGEIAKWLEAKVAHYKKLRGGVRFVAEIPKNPSGKILRRVLKQQGAEEAKGAQAKL